MWQWKPTRSIASLFATRTAASRAAPVDTVKPNFESSAPVAMYSCVCASTPGVTRTSTRGRGRPPATSASMRSSSWTPSTTSLPTPSSSVESELELRLVVPVEHQALGGEAGPVRDVSLAAGRDVEIEPLLVDETRHRHAEERLAGVRDSAVAERGAVVAAPGAQLAFVVHVERGTERLRQREVAAADRQTAVAVDGRGTRKQAQVDRGVPGRSPISRRPDRRRRCVPSRQATWTPRIASALARARRQASASHSLDCVRLASSLMTRQSR